MDARKIADLEKEVQRLRSALDDARARILIFVPEPGREAISRLIEPGDQSSTDDWEQWAIEEIVGIAEPKSAADMGKIHTGSDRAYCPLCGGSSELALSAKGYGYPDGLRRHLKGKVSPRGCPVFSTIKDMYMESRGMSSNNGAAS